MQDQSVHSVADILSWTLCCTGAKTCERSVLLCESTLSGKKGMKHWCNGWWRPFPMGCLKSIVFPPKTCGPGSLEHLYCNKVINLPGIQRASPFPPPCNYFHQLVWDWSVPWSYHEHSEGRECRGINYEPATRAPKCNRQIVDGSGGKMEN